jgi:hypothetical protein
MDLKDFREGLISLSFLLFLFSLTFMLGSILLGPYINLDLETRNFIIILCCIKIVFSMYYAFEAIQLPKIFNLEEKHIIKFGKRIALLTIFYTPQTILLGIFLLRELHQLQIMMILIIIPLELCLVGVVFKEAYDLLFLDEDQRKFELAQNRLLYLKENNKQSSQE